MKIVLMDIEKILMKDYAVNVQTFVKFAKDLKMVIVLNAMKL